MVQATQKTLRQLPFTIEVVRYQHPIKQVIRPEYIISEVCEYFRLTDKQITAKNRKRTIVTARMLAMYFIYKLCPEQSLSSIGRMFGNRDHTTVIHSKNTVVKFVYGPDPIWKDYHDYFHNLFN